MGKGALGRRAIAVQCSFVKKRYLRSRGCFFLVLYPQMRSFPIRSLSKWEAEKEDYSWGLNRFVALIAPQKAALKAARW